MTQHIYLKSKYFHYFLYSFKHLYCYKYETKKIVRQHCFLISHLIYIILQAQSRICHPDSC